MRRLPLLIIMSLVASLPLMANTGCGSVGAGKTMERRQPVSSRDPMLATKTLRGMDAQRFNNR